MTRREQPHFDVTYFEIGEDVDRAYALGSRAVRLADTQIDIANHSRSFTVILPLDAEPAVVGSEFDRGAMIECLDGRGEPLRSTSPRDLPRTVRY